MDIKLEIGLERQVFDPTVKVLVKTPIFHIREPESNAWFQLLSLDSC